MAIAPIGKNHYYYDVLSGGKGLEGGVSQAASSGKTDFFPEECQTCANRKYQDRSNDLSVSFQTPTHISPSQSMASVVSHEYEHVTNNRAKAEQEGMTAHSSVTLSYAVCPECGRMYVSGGKTTTVYTPKQSSGSLNEEGQGGIINMFA
jgi:hypothetical protein